MVTIKHILPEFVRPGDKVEGYPPPLLVKDAYKRKTMFGKNEVVIKFDTGLKIFCDPGEKIWIEREA